MKRILVSMVAVVLAQVLAVSAEAARSVTLVASGPFTPGSLITLHTYVTANGGETDNTMFGAIQYPDPLINTNPAGNSQVPLFSAIGALTCTTAFCVSFSQVNAAGPIAINATDLQLATTTFVIDPATSVGSVINFAWRTTPTTQRFDFFGLTNAPGVSVTVVPEPTTAALLGLGLLGLTVASRRRTVKRISIGTMTAMLVTLLPPAAEAATNLSLVASGPFTPGSLITLRTFVTANGGETDNTMFGAINYTDALVNSNAAGNSQTPLMTSIGALTCTTAFCVAFSQVNAAGPIAVNVTNLQLAMTTFVIDPATAVGAVINFAWRTTPSTARLDFFGITNSPGVSVTVVPEPTTALLLGAGLLGLALARRRAS